MTRPTDPNPARALARSRWDNDPRTSRTCAECHAPMDTVRIYCSGRCRTRARRRLAREGRADHPPRQPPEPNGATG